MTYFFLGAALAILASLSATSVAAQGADGQREAGRKLEVAQRGQINDGPLAGYSFSGTCAYTAEGGALFDDKWEPTFNSPAGVKAATMFAELYDAGAMPPGMKM